MLEEYQRKKFMPVDMHEVGYAFDRGTGGWRSRISKQAGQLAGRVLVRWFDPKLAPRPRRRVSPAAELLRTDKHGIRTYAFSSANNGYGPNELRVLTPSNPVPGMPHRFLYVLPVEAGRGNVYGDGLRTVRACAAQHRYNLTVIEPSFGIEPWYADNPNDPACRHEGFMVDDLAPWVARNLATTGDEQHWLVGFSKSGIGAIDLILRHPEVFTLAAGWDFPAGMASYDEFESSSADAYGTEANFQDNYRLTPAFVSARRRPFLAVDRLWIGGYSVFRSDMSDFGALLASEGILHTTGTPREMPHTWDGGWLPAALQALNEKSAALEAQALP